ncbi:MAG: outer membrane beta-barrel protein [Cyclobacteriaceae bacterium]
MNFSKLIKNIVLSHMIVMLSIPAFSQDEEEAGLVISGSVDTYYTYDFSGNDNIGTSFADDRNSISIGMIDVGLSHTLGRASFVGEVSFGPRSFKSIPLFDLGDGDDAIMGIQNLYVSYAVSDVVSLTAGYMGTFVGYEVISPAGNFNYSTSYLFTNGPFQNSGLKADFAFADNFSVMVGLFNDWNVYTDDNGVSDFGAQVYFAPVDGWDVYLNFVSGSPSGTVLDITTGYQITDGFYLGLNAADYSISGSGDSEGGYSGVALYPQVGLSDNFSLGLRSEYFSFKDQLDESGTLVAPSENVFSNTLTGNFSLDQLTFIAEVRLDGASEDVFIDSDALASSSASQMTLAAIYKF